MVQAWGNPEIFPDFLYYYELSPPEKRSCVILLTLSKPIRPVSMGEYEHRQISKSSLVR